MFTYAVVALTLKKRYRPRLLSSHMDEFGAWTSFRAAPPPAILARVDDGSLNGVSILSCKGLNSDELDRDRQFFAEVRALLQG